MTTDFSFFYGYAPQVTSRAPGRIEFIGNHTDYNGGLTMGVAVDRGVTVEAALRDASKVRITTTHGETAVEIDLDKLVPQKGSRAWSNYVLGVLSVLREKGMKLDRGVDVHVQSDLPSGAGLSSSAALELASALAFSKLYDFPMNRAELARVGRRAENSFVGMPCGILDQGSSAFGKKDSLVRIDCAKEEFTVVPMPAGLHLWVFNTMEKHSLVESLYATRHKECMDAFELLRKAGTRAKCLAEVSPEEVRRAGLPAILQMRALHVTEEHRRVMAMSAALEKGDTAEIGRLLVASHDSSRSLFENSTEKLDALVQILCRTNGVIGARLTGGGFGGAAMALALPRFGQAEAEAVCAEFSRNFPGVVPSVFSTSAGDGARLV